MNDKTRVIVAAVLVVPILTAAPSLAAADRGVDGSTEGGIYSPGVILEATDGVPAEQGEVQTTGEGSGPQATYQYEWILNCFNNYPGELNEMCPSARNCDAQGQYQWTLWARQLTSASGEPVQATWQPVLTECYTGPPPAPEAAPQPQVTDALVLQAVRRLGLPRLTVQVQPSDETLVNFDTIFYAEPPSWARTVQLLGFTVDVDATPTGYDWRFGDGETATTQTAGAPYPAKDITHAYTDAGVRVQPRVDTAYEIRYRVDDGGWQTIAETVPAAGLPVALRIREATPVLVGD